MLKQYIEFGKIVSTHGIKGEMKVQLWTNEPNLLLDYPVFYLDKGKTPLEVVSARVHKNMLLLMIEGVGSIDEANKYRGKTLYLDREDDEDDRPYLQDYVGMRVTDIDTKESYGKITDVLVTGANDVFALKDDKGVERLVPDIPQVIISSDFTNMTMEIRPLEGLFDNED